MRKIALYLAGGGARGAYQAGVLKAVDHILQVKRIPFSVVSGVSVGSINACVLAENADDFSIGVEKLNALWRDIHCHKIYNASNFALSKSLLRNLSMMCIKQRQPGYLLNTRPLREFIETNVDFKKLNQNIADEHLETIEIIANCYETQQTLSFYNHGNNGFEDWHYPRHASLKVELNSNHILASSALPLFFPTININGYHYGDGSMGLVSPLRGSIRFQVDKILILGTRQVARFNYEEEPAKADGIGFAHILGGMLNGLFMDNLDRDIEMVNRMNEIARLLSMWKKRYSSWRPVQTLHLRPSRDMAQVAEENYHHMPAFLRMTLNLLGARSQSGDLLSFLLFEPGFTTELIKLGYQDTIDSAAEVEAFFK